MWQQAQWYLVSDILHQVFSYTFLNTIQYKYTLVCKTWYHVANTRNFVEIYNMNSGIKHSFLNTKDKSFRELAFDWIYLLPDIVQDELYCSTWMTLSKKMTIDVEKPSKLPIKIDTKEPIVRFGIPYRDRVIPVYVYGGIEKFYISAYTDSNNNIVSDVSEAVKLHVTYFQYYYHDFGYGDVDQSYDVKNMTWISDILRDIVSVIGDRIFYSFLEAIYKQLKLNQKKLDTTRKHFCHHIENMTCYCVIQHLYGDSSSYKYPISQVCNRINTLTILPPAKLRKALLHGHSNIARRLVNYGYTLNADTLLEVLFAKCRGSDTEQFAEVVNFIFEYMIEKKYSFSKLQLLKLYNATIMNGNIKIVSQFIKHKISLDSIWAGVNFQSGKISQEIFDYLEKNVPSDQWHSPVNTKLKPIVSKPVIKHVIICHNADDKRMFNSTYSPKSSYCIDNQTIEVQVVAMDKNLKGKRRKRWIEQLKQNQVDTVTYYMNMTKHAQECKYHRVFECMNALFQNLMEAGIQLAFAIMIPQNFQYIFIEIIPHFEQFQSIVRDLKFIPLVKASNDIVERLVHITSDQK
jgi:hypothetical protein